MSFSGPRGPPPPPSLGGVPLLPGQGYSMPQPVLGLPVMGPPGFQVPVVGIPGGMPPGIPPPMAAQDRRPRMPFAKPPAKNLNSQSSTEDKASTITVFVGNITERATDNLVRAILAKCGYIANWKRAHGANCILQGFGFCEFSEPDAAMRAIRLLNEMEIGDKKLMVKADAKTKEMLAKYEVERRTSTANGSTDDYDELSKKVDQEVLDQIEQLLKVHAAELKQKGNSEKEKADKDKERGPRGNRVLIQESMDDMELDEEKKSLITREIDKFRDAYKKEEEEGGNRKDDKRKRSPSPGGRKRERERRRSRSPRPRSPRRSPERSRRSPDGRPSDRKNREQRQSSVDDDERYQKELREKAKEREREFMRMEREKRREDKLLLDESEEEEMYERRRNEKRLREKEANYQDHLKQWETREKRRAKEYLKEKEREEERLSEEHKEARRLREFFEDYDDERDDLRFYNGTSLQRRSRERQREMEWDLRDRQREREEFDELKKKLVQEGHPDPEGEAQRQLQPQPQPGETDQVDAATDPERIDIEDTPPIQKPPQRKEKTSRIHPDEEERAAREQREAKEKTKEDKLRHIKTLVEKIPSNKEQLFAYDLDRSLVDDTLMEKRVRPWINKKIVEYIGEEEATLVDFICSKIIAGADAMSLLGDVSMVLDDEAENFVVKMWRLLIYEVEAKKVSLESSNSWPAASTSSH